MFRGLRCDGGGVAAQSGSHPSFRELTTPATGVEYSGLLAPGAFSSGFLRFERPHGSHVETTRTTHWPSPRQIVVRGQQWNRGIQAGPAPVFRPNSARLIGVLNAKHQVDWQMLIGSGSLRVSANRIPSAPAARVDFLVHQFRQRPIRERLNGVSTSSHTGARTRRRSRRSQRRSWRARPRRCPRRRAVTDWPARWVEETDEPAGRFQLRLGLSVR